MVTCNQLFILQKNTMSKIVVNFNFPYLTTDAYNDIIAEPIRKANFPGLLFHVAAPKGAGMFVCDIWESEAHFEAFNAVMLPVLIKAGGTLAQRSVFPIHHLINAL
jgi:hypothetical protein